MVGFLGEAGSCRGPHNRTGTVGTYREPLCSLGFRWGADRAFPLLLDLFGKEIETQRAWKLIEVDILALMLIALHKQLIL